MDTLDGLKTIVAVVETGSFTLAADRLGTSKALVSKYVSQVESDLSVRLFNRTTRRIAITQAGKEYYELALDLLDRFDALQDTLQAGQHNTSGSLRVTASQTFAEEILYPRLSDFMQCYPHIQLDLIVTNKKLDLIENGIDVAIRAGELVDSSLNYRPIKTLSYSLYAVPELLTRIEKPIEASDLNRLPCLIDTNMHADCRWPIRQGNGDVFYLPVTPVFRSNNPRVIRKLAIDGTGIAFLPDSIVAEHVLSGTLVRLLPHHPPIQFQLSALFPNRTYLPEKTRVFLDFIKQHV
ncbi:LysR family transcriptional regulator [Vibrio albus]|uniref:LysR family transcriptional regulator n=1 Tax=Vibrio albus TaxID=2200953 RepID=A0A2U3BA34_9VIBR|nr:LysR family transcriptional regulator [Vibrio albus]PWI33595.1 LysR family transcriptional regulator [Vibrio albus]